MLALEVNIKSNPLPHCILPICNVTLVPVTTASVHSYRHENGACRKLSSNRTNLRKPALRFSVDRKIFENGAFLFANLL